MAPAAQRRLEDALRPAPAGAALEAATASFVAGRESFRQLFVDADGSRAARRHALSGQPGAARTPTKAALERYGTEPGTCEESAATGLPQVTVPAGFMGGRYPVGVSFLGRHVGRPPPARAWPRLRTGDAPPAPAAHRQVTRRGKRPDRGRELHYCLQRRHEIACIADMKPTPYVGEFEYAVLLALVAPRGHRGGLRGAGAGAARDAYRPAGGARRALHRARAARGQRLPALAHGRSDGRTRRQGAPLLHGHAGRGEGAQGDACVSGAASREVSRPFWSSHDTDRTASAIPPRSPNACCAPACATPSGATPSAAICARSSRTLVARRGPAAATRWYWRQALPLAARFTAGRIVPASRPPRRRPGRGRRHRTHVVARRRLVARTAPRLAGAVAAAGADRDHRRHPGAGPRRQRRGLQPRRRALPAPVPLRRRRSPARHHVRRGRRQAATSTASR